MNVTAKKVKGTEGTFELRNEAGEVVGQIEKQQDFAPTKMQGNVALAWRKRTYYVVTGVARTVLGASLVYRNSAKAVAEYISLYTR